MKTLKKIFSLLLVLVLAASLFPTAALAARTGISTIIAVSEDIQTPTMGEEIQRPIITVTSGWPAYFDDDSSNTWGWERKNASTGYWECHKGGYFTPGTWRYSNQIRIDGVDGGKYTHYLDYPFTVTVNGEEWTTSTVIGGYSEADVSYGWAYSPEYVIPETRTYTVWFNSNGHGTAPEPQVNLYDTPVIEPEEPTAEGYRFDGWYDSPECVNKWNFDVALGRDITLYAKWVPLVTEISFGGMTRPVVGKLPPTNMTVYSAEGATRTLSKWHIYDTDAQRFLSTVSLGDKTLSVEEVKVAEQTVYVYVMEFSADEGYEFSKSLCVLHNGHEISKVTATTLIRNPVQTCWYVKNDGDIRVQILPKDMPVASLPTPTPEPLGSVVVTNGYGSGSYTAGDEVSVAAMSPMGCTAFDKWVVTSGNVTLTDETASVTTFTMPDGEVTLKATYKEYHADVSRASCAFRGTCADCGQEVGELGDHWYVEEAWGYRQADGHAHLCEFCDAHTTPIPHTYDDNNICTDPACGYIWTAPLYIGGIAMEDGDYLAVGATEVSSSKPAGGYAYLAVEDSGAVQLTLHDFFYTGRGRGVDVNDYAAISSKNSMIILLEGDNTICSTSEEYGWDYGIFGNSSIEIRGNAAASLQVTADEMALCAAGELTVSGGAKVTLVGVEAYAVNASSIDYDWETYYIYASRDADGSTREGFYLSGLPNYKYLRLGRAYSPGDVDGNGTVDKADAMEILKYTVGMPSVFGTCDAETEAMRRTAADLAAAYGVIDARDATQLMRQISGLGSVYG